tara:strand:- start:1601 stop:1702 length:102 start_codon:yes stop_codon:yes gene_type:complete
VGVPAGSGDPQGEPRRFLLFDQSAERKARFICI